MFVYLLGNLENRVLKVGVSRSPEERMAQLQKYNPFDLELFATLQFEDLIAATEYEGTVLRWLRAYKLRGEWLRIKGLVKEFVAAARAGRSPDELLRVIDDRDALAALESYAENRRVQCGAQSEDDVTV